MDIPMSDDQQAA